MKYSFWSGEIDAEVKQFSIGELLLNFWQATVELLYIVFQVRVVYTTLSNLTIL